MVNRNNLEWRKLNVDSERYTYWVSNYGDVKRSAGEFIDRGGRHCYYPERTFLSEDQSLLGGNKAQGEYRGVNLEGVKQYAHRLAALAFIANPYNKPEINHKDGVTTNNYCGCKANNYTDSNLEWVTRKENMEHASAKGLINHESLLRKMACKENRKKVDYSKRHRPVYQIDTRTGAIVKEFPSIVMAAEKNGLHPSNIGAVVRKDGYHLTAGGYFWIYKETYDSNGDYSLSAIQRPIGKAVQQFDLNGKLLAEYENTRDAYRKNNWYTGNYIGECCNGKRSKYKGYLWKWKC